MKLETVRQILDAEILTDNEIFNKTEILSACGCDLMSDVLAFVKNQALLLTGLVNAQVVRTAEMMDMKAIVFVRGKMPTDDIIDLAKEAKITIMSTNLPLYIACGKLYKSGLYND